MCKHVSKVAHVYIDIGVSKVVRELGVQEPVEKLNFVGNTDKYFKLARETSCCCIIDFAAHDVLLRHNRQYFAIIRFDGNIPPFNEVLQVKSNRLDNDASADGVCKSRV